MTTAPRSGLKKYCTSYQDFGDKGIQYYPQITHPKRAFENMTTYWENYNNVRTSAARFVNCCDKRRLLRLGNGMETFSGGLTRLQKSLWNDSDSQKCKTIISKCSKLKLNIFKTRKHQPHWYLSPWHCKVCAYNQIQIGRYE